MLNLGLWKRSTRGVEELSKAVSPLSSIAFQFNLETDSWMKCWGGSTGRTQGARDFSNVKYISSFALSEV